MFTEEFLQLFKEYNQNEGENKNKILKSLYKLAKENESEFLNLSQRENTNPQFQNLLKDLEKYNQEIEEIKKEDGEEDIIQLRKAFDIWNKEYDKQSNVNENCINIVDSIVQKYYENKPHIISTLLDVKNNEQYELFKNHLKNTLRAKVAQEIENYFESPRYKELNFFDRLRKERKIRKELKKIIKYEFDFKQIKEVLK